MKQMKSQRATIIILIVIFFVYRNMSISSSSRKVPGIKTDIGVGSSAPSSSLPSENDVRVSSHAKENKHHLKPFVTDFLRSHEPASRNIKQICTEDTSFPVLEEWKTSHNQRICETEKGVFTATEGVRFLVHEYTLYRWEHQPTVRRYYNVESWSMHGPQYDSDNCRSITERPGGDGTEKEISDEDKNREETGVVLVTATVITIRPFDWYNSYERFHAFVNVAMVMIMLDIRDPILVFICKENKKPPKEEDRDAMETWRVFSKHEPVIIDLEQPQPKNRTRYHFLDFIEAPICHVSMLNTKTRSRQTLMGVGRDHHCESLLFRAIVAWIRERFVALQAFPVVPETSNNNKTINVIWSSRQPYCCRNHGEVWHPKRVLKEEAEWIKSLGQSLGPAYNVTAVDFGKLSTWETIRLVEQQNILVGVHGAGLIWSVFLPSGKQQNNSTGGAGWNNGTNNSINSGLVEIFLGNRNPSNRHYHNIASLAGLDYRETPYWQGGEVWDKKLVDLVVKQIHSINKEKKS